MTAGAAALAAAPSASATPKQGGPKPSLQVYFASDFKDAAYQKTCFDALARVWALPSELPAPGRRTVVQTTIRRDGSLGSAIVSMASGSKAWDKAATQAIRKASPFGALPKSYPGPQVEVHWHFELAKPQPAKEERK
jgi:TonB family protein